MIRRENIAFEGELQVRKEGLWSPWAPRWFSITEDGRLLCSKRPEVVEDGETTEGDEEEVYTIHIEAIEVSSHQSYRSQMILKLPSRGKNHFIFLKCSTYEDRDLWLTALKRAQELAISGDSRRNSISQNLSNGFLGEESVFSQLDESHRLFKEHKDCTQAAERISTLMSEQYQNTPLEVALHNLLDKFSAFVAASDQEYNELEKKYHWLKDQENLRETNMEVMAQQFNTLERKTRTLTGMVRDKMTDDSEVLHTLDQNEDNDDDEFFDAVEHDKQISSRRLSMGLIEPEILTPGQTASQKITLDDVNEVIPSYRQFLPCDKSNKPLNVWKFLKDCIGKEFSRITMPIILNEPLSGTQRYAEDMESGFLLNKATEVKTSNERMMYVACFIVSAYRNTARTGKPFNPLLGETFELDLRNDPNYGFRLLSEQVSHHPPVTAIYSEGKNWQWYKQVDLKSSFKGKTLEITPVGTVHVHIGDEHYTWNCVKSTVNNIVFGTLWVDSGGEMKIINHKTKEYCLLNFEQYSYFGSGEVGNVTGTTYNAQNQPRTDITGNWKEGFVSTRPHGSSKKWVCRWKKTPLPPGAEKQFLFTKFTMILNELRGNMKQILPCTDSRFRPDLRVYEEGELDEGQEQKTKLEEKQRARRREREANGLKHQPMWFEQKYDEDADEECWKFKEEYWQRNFENVPTIY